MKHIHHLSTTGLVAATAVTVIIGEAIGWYVTRLLDIRFPAFTVGMVCVGLVAATVSLLYDGRE